MPDIMQQSSKSNDPSIPLEPSVREVVFFTKKVTPTPDNRVKHLCCDMHYPK